MDFNLNQWSHESEQQQEDQQLSAKLPRYLFDYSNPQPPSSSSSSSVLPLFLSQPNTNTNTNNHMSACSSDTKLPRMGLNYFSSSQLQELELQALIYRHMLAGAVIPHELLHLIKKSIVSSSSSSSSPYYLPHQYYPHYQPASLQSSGYWGRAAMDPEPGRCRRTDGKKWRCSRDVVAGHKYCERHMNRGRNRSRKPVETPTSAASPYGGGEAVKSKQGVSGGGGGGGSAHFTLTAAAPSQSTTGLLNLDNNKRPSDSIIEANGPLEDQDGGRMLRHFFDDWPKPQRPEPENAAASLSISMPENPSSDFSLKLGTGNGDKLSTGVVSSEREDHKPHWDWAMSWAANPMGPMGGPLAEAFRSSMSSINSSPTSVLLHQLPRGLASEASFNISS